MTDKSQNGAEVAVECAPAKAPPRDRITGAARDLFHKHGIRGIGVDAIAEAAGTNKMTLYRHFGSKDDLIVQCLRSAALEANAWWAEIESDNPDDPAAQLRAWVQDGAECMCDDRGCELANAAVELTKIDHPARRVIEEIKTEHRSRLANLCRRAGIAEADLLADTLSLLLEGARVSRQSVGAEGPSAKFARMCETLIASFQVPKAAQSRRRRRPATAEDTPRPLQASPAL
jgi:AcrR family transcriptional regulator